jgi:tetratricopeptide (TPR) repeat protein
MMSTKNICVVTICLLVLFISTSPVFAAKWYENYQQAEYLMEREEWATAIELLKKAIDEEPDPGEHKRTYGVRFIEYYPYLKLGEAYLEIGDSENARRYCEKAKEKGEAPKEAIERCLQDAKSAPTPSPSPTPTPQPEDTAPSIEFTSVIPNETELETLKVQGIATDDNGIKEVSIGVKKAGEKGLVVTTVLEGKQRKQEQLEFSKDVRLEVGRNEIVIEVTDTVEQVARWVFPILRKDITGTAAKISPDLIQRPGNVYAVIIGIGDYADKRLNLRFTVNDAQGLYDVLTDPRYGGVPKDHVQLLLNQDATDRNIKGAIGQWLKRQAKKGDTVIIYYSGHGAPEGEDTYWVTYNANIDDLYTTALNNNDITEMLASIESERVITFLDSCYSAATVQKKDRTKNIQMEIPWEKFSGKGRVAISASDGKQLSLELDQYQHGVFTYYLLEGLKGQADDNLDGVIEVDEIWDYVKYQVTETARKAGNLQNPVRQGPQTAGIPLTFNMIHLKQRILAELFQKGLIEPGHFNCAFKMLGFGKTNPVLEGLLSGEIEPEVFRATFQCDSQK